MLAGASSVAGVEATKVPGLGENVAWDPGEVAWRQFLWLLASESGSEPLRWESWAQAAEVLGDPDSAPVWPRRPESSSRWRLDEALTEVRYDRVALEWIASRGLWHRDGQDKLFERFAKGTTVDVAFPSGSVVIKARWLRVTSPAENCWPVRRFAGAPVSLVAVHVMSKLSPTWFWATFARRGCEAPAPSLVSADLEGLARASFELLGTQTSWTDAFGRPVTLGNPHIEEGALARSSCMGCHSRASIGESGRLRVESRIGLPEPSWFLVDTGPDDEPHPAASYLPLDFVWSLARALPRSVDR